MSASLLHKTIWLGKNLDTRQNNYFAALAVCDQVGQGISRRMFIGAALCSTQVLMESNHRLEVPVTL